MHSSYNVIKENRVVSKTTKKICTEAFVTNEDKDTEDVTFEEAQSFLSNYQNVVEDMLADAKFKSEKYILESIEKSKVIEKEAYEKGYAQGHSNGLEDGYKEAYEKYIPEARKQAEDMITNAEVILSSAKSDYERYLELKRNEILELVLTVSNKVLKNVALDVTAINKLIDEAIELSKDEENIVIRCNSIYEEELKKNVPVWKTLNNIKGEIFIMADNSMNPGNAIIEKKSGKIEVGIDIGLEKLREAIL